MSKRTLRRTVTTVPEQHCRILKVVSQSEMEMAAVYSRAYLSMVERNH